jgi:hypothetical protein
MITSLNRSLRRSVQVHKVEPPTLEAVRAPEAAFAETLWTVMERLSMAEHLVHQLKSLLKLLWMEIKRVMTNENGCLQLSQCQEKRREQKTTI